jgi:hypothetical protein
VTIGRAHASAGATTTLDLVTPLMLSDGDIEGFNFSAEPTIATPEQLQRIPRIP